VWPAHPVPLPVIGIGRLVRDGATAELWTSWRIQSGNSGGPVLGREHGRLRVAAVTHVQHDVRRSRERRTHSALVLRAYVAAVDGGGRREQPPPTRPAGARPASAVQRFSSSIGASLPPQRRHGRSNADSSSPTRQ
jgi:hypothetical protein